MSFSDKSVTNKLDVVLRGLTTNLDKNSKLGQHNFNIQLGTPLATMTIADSTGTVTYDHGNNGWNWSNAIAGQKLNLYFYTGTVDNKTLSDLQELNFSMVNFSTEKPYIVVYTKPTGTNDHDTWYHSAIYYKPSEHFVVGHVHYEFGSSHLNLDNKPKKPLNRWFSYGESRLTEEILYITLHTSSGEDALAYNFTIDHFGYKFKNDDMVSIKLSYNNTLEQLNNTLVTNSATQITSLSSIKSNSDTLVTNSNSLVSNSESTDENVNFIYQNVLQMSDKLTDIGNNTDTLVSDSSTQLINLSNIENNTNSLVTNSGTQLTNLSNIETNTDSLVTNTNSLVTNSSTQLTNLSNIETNTDSLVTNSSTQLTNLGNIETNTDTLVTNSGTQLTNLGNIETNTDTLVTNSGTTNTTLSDILAELVALNVKQQAILDYYNSL